MPISNLIEFILYIVPGFIALQIYHSYYPVKKKSDFHYITLSIIYGISATSLIKLFDIHFLNNYLNSNANKFPSFSFVITIILSGIALGIIIIFFHNIRFIVSNKFQKLEWLTPEPESIWVKINQPTNEDWAVVYLNDNSIYLGWISEYGFDPNRENHDFLLLNAKRIDENLNEIYTVDGLGVYLNTRDIKRIEFIKGR